MYYALIALHVTCAAILFGAPLGVVGAVRRAHSLGTEALRHAAAEAARKSKIAAGMSIGVLLSGVGLVLLRGGFAQVGKNIHTSMTLLIVAILFSAFWMRPNTARLVVAANAETPDDAGVDGALKKLGMGSGILQGLWIAILVLMFYSY